MKSEKRRKRIKIFQKNFEDYFEANFLTMQAAAERFGVTPQAIHQWLHGISMPTFSNLQKVAKSADKSVKEFMEDTNE